MDGTSLVEDARDEATASWALHAVREMSGTGRRALSAAKQIAAVALCLQAVHGVRAEEALQTAGRVYARRLKPTPAALKKVVSEARAVLQLGVPARLADELRGQPLERLLPSVDAALRGVNQTQVTRARAEALAGGRGGRPIQPARTAYGAVLKLLDLVRAGDQTARAEFLAIQDLMRSTGPLTHTADRRAASR